MAESPNRLQIVFDLLASVGYTGDENSVKSASEILCGGLSWCVSVLNSDPPQDHDVFSGSRTQDDIVFEIAEALRLMKCPHPISACQIKNLDCQSIFSVVHWLVDRVRTSRGDRKDENQEKFDVLNQLQRLRKRIAKRGDETKVHMLVSLVQSRKELAALMRTILVVRRKLDSVPSQSELIQYERRFSELYTHIQGKHHQTQRYYDTYNTLLEIKELMLKETSLMNSLSSQFQDAISSTAGRVKLMESMDGVVKGSRQKLEKVQLGLQEQQQVCDALKERYTAEITAQRQWYFLLKVFQVLSFNTSEYQVRDEKGMDFTINIQNKTCTCRKFQEDEIPCGHAVAVIAKRNLNVYEYCASFYKTETLKALYQENVRPLPHKD